MSRATGTSAAVRPIGEYSVRPWIKRSPIRQTRRMSSARAGQPAASDDLINVDKLVAAYYEQHPDPSLPEQRVSFGTSGHRGSSVSATFNEDHILATSQAICEYRA